MGYKDFYVHYSFLSAIIASLLTKFLRGRGRVFYWNCGEPWKYKRTAFRERFERWAYSLVSFLVTGTEKLGEEYVKFYEIPRKKIKVMPNWIDNERFHGISDKNSFKRDRAIPEDRKVIFFAHHLSFRKGSRMILPVARELLRLRKDFFMIIVGSGPDEQNLRDRVNKTDKLSAYVRITGAVPNRDIQKYFGVADVFFMPSQEEGFPRVILESMASGVPVVASDVGSVPEIIPSEMSPFIVDPNDGNAFVSAINALLSQTREETEKMRAVLLARAESFETSKIVRIFVGLFKDLPQ